MKPATPKRVVIKIAFADNIWSRLYGPYGNRSVELQLRMLSEKWDNAVAKELFWEELHHQDDIYPATFAALPWLVALSPSKGLCCTNQVKAGPPLCPNGLIPRFL
jgi:hypothetical protein